MDNGNKLVSKNIMVSLSNRYALIKDEEINEMEKIFNFHSIFNQKFEIQKEKDKESKSQDQVKIREKLHAFIDSSMVTVDNLLNFLSIFNNEKYIAMKTIEDVKIMQKESDIIEIKRLNYIKKLHYLNKSCESLSNNMILKLEKHEKSHLILEKIPIIKKYFFTISEDVYNLKSKKIKLSNTFLKKFQRFFKKSFFEDKFTFYLEIDQIDQRKIELSCDYVNNLTRFPKFQLEVVIDKELYKYNIEEYLDEILLKSNEYLFRKQEERFHFVEENPQIFSRNFCKLIKVILFKLIKIEFYTIINFYKSNILNVNNFNMTLTNCGKQFDISLNNGDFFKLRFITLKKEESKAFNEERRNESSNNLEILESIVRSFVSDLLSKIKYDINLDLFYKFVSEQNGNYNSFNFDNLNSTLLSKNLLKLSKTICREQFIKLLNNRLQHTDYTIAKNMNINILNDNYLYNYNLLNYKLIVNDKTLNNEIKSFSLNFHKNKLYLKIKKRLETNIFINDNNKFSSYTYDEWSYSRILSILLNYVDLNKDFN